MRTIHYVIIAAYLLATQLLANEPVIVSGFGQIKTDSAGFSIPKVRVILAGPVETGFNGVKVSYLTYTDFDKEGKPELGFAQINFRFPQEWTPQVVIGRTLDPISYQFPAPFALPVLNYPVASFNHPFGLGIFMQEDWQGIWGMVGITNGTAKFKDDNKSLDFTGRLSYDLPFGFTPGVICRAGQQPNGYRQILGGDLSWQNKKGWINSGQNTINYNGRRTGRWLMTTIDLSKYFQLVGLAESLKSSDKTTTGWSTGINFFPSPKTVIRINLYRLAVNRQKGWGILFQQRF